MKNNFTNQSFFTPKQLGLGIVAPHTHIGLFLRRNLGKLLIRDPQIAKRLTRLKFPEMSHTFLPFLCENFKSITWVELEFLYHRQLDELAKLKHLTHLSIRSNRRPYSTSPLCHLNHGTIVKVLPKLKSITKLFVLDFNIRDELLRIIFPNAQISRSARGNQNIVDYKTVYDAINFNRLNWRQIDLENLDQVLQREERRVLRQRNFV